jgi:hypothetical protein
MLAQGQHKAALQESVVRVGVWRQSVLNERYVSAREEGIEPAHFIPERSRLDGLPVVDAFCFPRGPCAGHSRQHEDLLALIPSEVSERDP